MNNKQVRGTAITRSLDWWYCDNIINKERTGQIGLLKMTDPKVFILIRNEADYYFCSFDEFKEHIAEVNFFMPAEREGTDIDEILVDAWNFMALQEEEEERQAILREEEDILDDNY